MHPDSPQARPLIQRPRLLHRFDDGTGGLVPLAVLHAPAGSGKSTLLAELLDSPLVEGFRICTTHADEGGDPAFWQVLGRALAPSDPQPSSNVDTDGRPSLHARIRALTEPTLLVVDDYQLLTTIENDRALLQLSRLNPLLHICVLARSVRVLDSPLYSHHTRVLDRDDLALTSDECRELIARTGAHPTPALLDDLAQAGGWPAAVMAALDSATTTTSDPRAALRRFAVDLLSVAEYLNPPSRALLLTASLLDDITLNQASRFSGQPRTLTRSHVLTLLQLGALTRSVRADATTYRVHSSLRAPLAEIATREFAPSQREALARGAAEGLERTNPLGALRIYLQATALAEAEDVLAAHFTTITDDEDGCLAALAGLADAELLKHPTFAAARLFLEFERPTVSPKRLWHTAQLSLSGAQRRLARNPDSVDRLHIGFRIQIMIGERLHGNVPTALGIAREIDALLASPTIAVPLSDVSGRENPGNQPVFLSQIAFTAFMGGDSALARRTWQRLDTLMTRKPDAAASAPPAEISRATTRHGRWQHAALSGLALVETNEGDFRAGAQLLARADEIRDAYGSGPSLAWANAEIVRAHHAYEFLRPDALQEATGRLSAWSDRIEQWPMMIMAGAEDVRYRRGVAWSLPHLRAEIAHVEESRHGVGVWAGYLALYQVMLHTTLGNFVTARDIVGSLPTKNDFVQIERARLDLFSGKDVQALLTIQRLGSASLNLRQRIDCLLISAIAAWGCGSILEAFIAIRDAGELIERCHLSMMLRSVPFEPLAALADAARDAGVCDVTALINDVPPQARCLRREPLTVMEQRALESMVSHPSLADAAEALGIAGATIKRHRLTVYKKLRVGSREEAILQATRMGLLSRRDGESGGHPGVTRPTSSGGRDAPRDARRPAPAR